MAKRRSLAARVIGGTAKGAFRAGKSVVRSHMVGGNLHNASASRSAGKRRKVAAKKAKKAGMSDWHASQMKAAAKRRKFWR